MPFKVGDRVEQGLHVVQLWVLHNERAEEVLVVYPPDGYWRARPLPPAHMRWSAYGSSFLVGPVEVQERPIVALKEISFDLDTKTFTMNFARGGSAKLTVERWTPIASSSTSSYRRPDGRRRPFMAMRSMYTTEYNADVAKVAWRTRGQGLGESPIMNWPGAEATELWAGRTAAVPPQHERARHGVQPLFVRAAHPDAEACRKTVATSLQYFAARPARP